MPDPMHLTAVQYLLGAMSGILVGFVLGLIGGGGSVLAVPLIVYLVKVPNSHIAIGTASIAVAVNAAISFLVYARKGLVKWHCTGLFAAASVVGAAAGSTLGKVVDSKMLLGLFALFMIAVAIFMLRKSAHTDDTPGMRLSPATTPGLVGTGILAGALSGFFGIGGGFLIVPSLIRTTGMPIMNAVGSSLLSVTALGATTAISYGLSGWIDVPLAVAFMAGGVAGGLVGTRCAARLTNRRGALNTVFACTLFLIAGYIVYRSVTDV